MKRFINIDSLLTNNRLQFGKLYDFMYIGSIVYPIFKDPVQIICEIYTPKGDYIGIDYAPKIIIHDNQLYIDIINTLDKYSLLRGSYKIVCKLTDSIYSNLKVRDISPDRTEIQLEFKGDYTVLSELQKLNQLNNVSLIKDDISNNIINYFVEDEFLYLKTINPIPDNLLNNDLVNIVYELSDSLVDSITILKPISLTKYNKLRSPKFDMDADILSTDSTVYKCWEELVGSNIQTSQNIIDKIFNADSSVVLNIDWTYFENYIFYSRAKIRIENFYTKVRLIDELKQKITVESEFTGDSVQKSIQSHENIIKTILENFDGFERYLYYVDDPKIFTHDLLGNVYPWPKEIINDEITLKDFNHPDVIQWYSNLLIIADKFDRGNTKSLWYSIPEHILMDDGNSQYILFVDMLGQHFDNIWLYVNALTQIHDKDEHYNRGPASELLEHIAKSFGWNLNNARSASDLWLYKLGTEENGDQINIDGMVSHEKQSYQVWRRIVNNLPYLLKTKGTSRSIRALMNIFGIPNTLISIKEYGGPGIDGDKPLLIEDRYHYKLHIKPYVSTDLTDWNDIAENFDSNITINFEPINVNGEDVESYVNIYPSYFTVISNPGQLDPVNYEFKVALTLDEIPLPGEIIKIQYDLSLAYGNPINYTIKCNGETLYIQEDVTYLTESKEFQYTVTNAAPVIFTVEFQYNWNGYSAMGCYGSFDMSPITFYKKSIIGSVTPYIKTNLSTFIPETPPCSNDNLPISKNLDFSKGFLHWDINNFYSWDIVYPYETVYPTLDTYEIDNVIYNMLEFGVDEYVLDTKMVIRTKLNLVPYHKYKFKFTAKNIYSDNTSVFINCGTNNYAYTLSPTDEFTEYEFEFISNIDVNYFSILCIEAGLIIGNFQVEMLELEARYPDTYEFRFQPEKIDISLNTQYLFSLLGKSIFKGSEKLNGLACTIELALDEMNNPISDNLYRLVFKKVVNNITDDVNNIVYSQPLPLYNGDMWTIRLYKKKYLLTDLTQTENYILYYDIASSNDCLYGKITHSDSGEIVNNIFNESLNYYDYVFYIGQPPINIVAQPENINKYSGYIQGYKEYFDVYTQDVFYQHVLNPHAYNTDSSNGTYYTLYKYFPLGLDLQRWGHFGSPGTHSSSQPNRNYTPDVLELYHFTDDQIINYKNDTETYYISVPKIGGRTLQSAKIRIEDSELESLLSIDKKSTVNEYDYTQPDSNKLAIVFSLADQINRDIFNHIGQSDLDLYIGSPLNELNVEYPELVRFRRDYFKKYQQKNEINTFIRLLSVYDYTFFEQIKQLVPGRANLIAGILLEPTILEKSKVKIFDKVSTEMEVYEPTIDGDIYDILGDLESIEGDLIKPTDIEIIYQYIKGELPIDYNVVTHYEYLKACIKQLIKFDSHISHTHINSGTIGVNICGIGDLASVIDKSRINCRYLNKTWLFDKYLSEEYSVYKFLDGIPTGYDGPLVTATSDQLSLIQNIDKRPYVKYIDVLDNLMDNSYGTFNLQLTNIPIPKGEYECRFYIELLDGTPLENDIVIDCEFTGLTQSGNGSFYLSGTDSTISRIIHPRAFDLITEEDDVYNLNITIESLGEVYTGSIIRFYGLTIYTKIPNYVQQLIELENRINNKNKYGVYSETSYQIDEGSNENVLRFIGSKLSGPAFNVPSLYTIDKGPVVEFYDVDPAVLIVDSNNESNLKIN